MSKEFINAVSSGDNLEAEAHFNPVASLESAVNTWSLSPTPSLIRSVLYVARSAFVVNTLSALPLMFWNDPIILPLPILTTNK